MRQAVSMQSQLNVRSCGDELESACTSMSRLLATAGHDLRQPLQVAVFAIERALLRSCDPEIDKRLATATKALHRLGAELDDLARFSQFPGGLPVKRRPVALGQMFADLEEHWSSFADACGVTLRLRRSDRTVVSDPAMLMTILRNLVGNAIKYSRRGGTVLVGCRMRGGEIAIEVHDQGEGIPRSRLKTIFEAFDRAGRENEPQSGLGLGLTIVLQTARALQHSIWVSSREGAGSTFIVTLPAADSQY
ncbi:HAMP domain-containing sensor histidine kinase [Methylorubrum rhodesianum]|uniref:histidine kinase n=1 Tax=Methylorubrum rhodesianum TaxID=29427 RepID=A0ABU9ZFH0_9HYPH